MTADWKTALPEGAKTLVEIEIFVDKEGRVSSLGHNHQHRQAFFTCSHRDLGDGLFECFVATRFVVSGRQVDGALVCDLPSESAEREPSVEDPREVPIVDAVVDKVEPPVDWGTFQGAPRYQVRISAYSPRGTPLWSIYDMQDDVDVGDPRRDRLDAVAAALVLNTPNPRNRERDEPAATYPLLVRLHAVPARHDRRGLAGPPRATGAHRRRAVQGDCSRGAVAMRGVWAAVRRPRDTRSRTGGRMSGYGAKLVAFVEAKRGSDGLRGRILGSNGGFELEVQQSGSDALEDYDLAPFDLSARGGIYMLEGFVHVDAGEDGDIQLLGEWRPLTLDEVVRLADGFMPWDASEPEDAVHLQWTVGGDYVCPGCGAVSLSGPERPCPFCAQEPEDS